MSWQLQEAKQKFSEVVDRAVSEGPQIVTRRGEEIVVVISIPEFKKLLSRKPDFKKFLMTGPNLDALELERSKDIPRDVDL